MESVANPTHQQRDIAALTAAVGVELVQNEELEPLSRPDQVTFLEPGQYELEHHVVGEQDVRRVCDNLPLNSIRFLACVTRKPDGATPVREPVAEELLQLAVLTVGEGVHWINDDRLDTLSRAPAQHVVDDGDDVGEALAGTRTGRQDIIVSSPGNADGLLLVSVEAKGLSFAVKVWFDPENFSAAGMQNRLVDQFIDFSAWLERRVELNQSLGPQQPRVELGLDLGVDYRVADLDETADVRGI